MHKNIENNKLFKGIDKSELEGLIVCLIAKEKNYKKNETLINQGSHIKDIGIVLEGEVQVLKYDVYGSKHIISNIHEGGIFAEVLVSSGITESPVEVIALEDCKILSIPYQNIISTCSMACGKHHQLIFNLLTIFSRKSLKLNEKISYLTCKTTREKIIMYLLNNMNSEDQTRVKIPYNRNQLSEFLSVNRSVLSRELSKMKEEGIIDFKKNEFKILDKDKMH